MSMDMLILHHPEGSRLFLFTNPKETELESRLDDSDKRRGLSGQNEVIVFRLPKSQRSLRYPPTKNRGTFSLLCEVGQPEKDGIS